MTFYRLAFVQLQDGILSGLKRRPQWANEAHAISGRFRKFHRVFSDLDKMMGDALAVTTALYDAREPSGKPKFIVRKMGEATSTFIYILEGGNGGSLYREWQARGIYVPIAVATCQVQARDCELLMSAGEYRNRLVSVINLENEPIIREREEVIRQRDRRRQELRSFASTTSSYDPWFYPNDIYRYSNIRRA